MDRRAFRQLRLRPPRPCPGHDSGDRLRRRGQYPGAAPLRLRRHGRLSFSVRTAAVDRQPGEEPRQRLPHAANRSGDQMRVHQHDLRIRLSRRRTARGQLLRRARARCRGPGTRHRPHRAAQAQHDPPARPAVQRRVRHDLRLRRLSRRAQACAATRRLRRVQEAQAR